jgi:hypothetical protein
MSGVACGWMPATPIRLRTQTMHGLRHVPQWHFAGTHRCPHLLLGLNTWRLVPSRGNWKQWSSTRMPLQGGKHTACTKQPWALQPVKASWLTKESCMYSLLHHLYAQASVRHLTQQRHHHRLQLQEKPGSALRPISAQYCYTSVGQG